MKRRVLANSKFLTLLIFCDMLARSLSLHSLFSHTQLPDSYKIDLASSYLCLIHCVVCWPSQSLSPGSWNLWTYSRNSIPIQHSLCLSSPLLCVLDGRNAVVTRICAQDSTINDRLISSYIYSVVTAGHYDVESLTARICPKVFAIQFQIHDPSIISSYILSISERIDGSKTLKLYGWRHWRVREHFSLLGD